MTKLFFTLFYLLVLIAGCARNDASIDLAKEEQNVRGLDQAMLLAETNRDLEKVMQYIGEEAIFHPPNTPPIVGRNSITGFYKEWFKIPYKEIVSENAEVWVSESGDFAYLIGNSYMGLNNSDGANRVNGKYNSIWKKVNNKWLCYFVSWSENEPSK